MREIQSEFLSCKLKNAREDPDSWFVRLYNINTRLYAIDPKYEKSEIEVIAHMLAQLPKEYAELRTKLSGTKVEYDLDEVKEEIRLFYNSRLKKNSDKEEDEDEAFLIENKKNKFKKKFKGTCRKCGKYGHKSVDCWSNNSNSNKKTESNNMKKNVRCYNCNRFGHISRNSPNKVDDVIGFVGEYGILRREY